MIRHEKAVGNSNIQKLELLKPKWVENDEFGRAIDSKTGDVVAPKIIIGSQTIQLYIE